MPQALSEERESEGGSAFQEEVFMEEVELQCKYWTCNFRCVSKADMTEHISKKHVIDEVFVCFKSTEEAKCPDCVQMSSFNHNFAMHSFTEHFYSFDCEHCKKNFPGDDGYFHIDMEMRKAPCDGNPQCPCQFWPSEAFTDMESIQNSASFIHRLGSVTIFFKCFTQLL